MKTVGDKFYVNMLVQGVSGMVTLVLDADSEYAGSERLLQAIKDGEFIRVKHMFTRQASVTPQGIMTLNMDAEDIDMGTSRLLDLGRVIALVEEFNEVGNENIKKIIGMMKDKGVQKSGIILADANTTIPTGEDAENAVRRAGQVESGLKDGNTRLVVARGGKG